MPSSEHKGNASSPLAAAVEYFVATAEIYVISIRAARRYIKGACAKLRRDGGHRRRNQMPGGGAFAGNIGYHQSNLQSGIMKV